MEESDPDSEENEMGACQTRGYDYGSGARGCRALRSEHGHRELVGMCTLSRVSRLGRRYKDAPCAKVSRGLICSDVVVF